VLSLPFFYSLRNAHPDAHITVVCKPWVSSLQFREWVDEVVVLPRAFDSSLLGKFEFLKELRSFLKGRFRGFDVGYSLPNSWSAALVLKWAGCRQRIGYRAEGRGWILTHPLDPWGDERGLSSQEVRHRSQAYLELLAESDRATSWATSFWGEPRESGSESIVGLQDWKPGVLSRFEIERAWNESDQLAPPPGSYWVLAPGATADSRRWNVEGWIELSRRIWKKYRIPGLIVGGAKEAPLGERLARDSELGLQDWTARGEVASLGQLFRKAQLTLSNESGLAHVASLCGSPVIIACGAADPRRTRPIGPGRVSVVVNGVDCWPCERNQCRFPVQSMDRYLACLKGLSVDAVWEEVQSVISV
jgi:ADP-heptose:LPS heptosyltransferase